MDKYLIRKPCTQDSSPVRDSSSSSKRIRIDFNLENLPLDPRLQEKISSYHPYNHDEIRRYYLQKMPLSIYFSKTLMITLYHIFLESFVDLEPNGM